MTGSSKLAEALPLLLLQEAVPYSMKAPIEISGTEDRISIFSLFLMIFLKRKKEKKRRVGSALSCNGLLSAQKIALTSGCQAQDL